jgi:hypothetical protein
MPAKTVQEFHQLFPEYMRNVDIEAALELYEPGAAFANQQGEVRVGLEALRQELVPFAAMKGELQIQPQENRAGRRYRPGPQ